MVDICQAQNMPTLRIYIHSQGIVLKRVLCWSDNTNG